MADKVADRWTVRGVPLATQRAVAEAARRAGLTVGQWVVLALESALDSPTTPHDAGDLASQVRELAERVARLEAAADNVSDVAADAGRQSFRRQRVSGAGNGRGGNPGYSPEIEAQIREMLLSRHSNAEIARQLGVDASSVSRRRSAMKEAGELS